MRRDRSPLLLAMSLLWSCFGATQETEHVDTPFQLGAVVHHGPELPAEEAFVLWVGYPSPQARWLSDHRQYLEDLQRRYKDKGVRVRVVVAPEVLAATAVAGPSFELAEWSTGGEGLDGPVLSALCEPDGGSLVIWPGVDGAVDFVEAAIAGTLHTGTQGVIDPSITTDAGSLLPSQLDLVGDAEANEGAVAHCVKVLPRSGRARALAVLFEWWCKGDLEAGRALARQGLREVAGESVPLVEFADLVLRGGYDEPELARQLAMALAPAAAAAPDGAFTQLVYLRALLRAGQDRIAGRLVATLPKLLGDDPDRQLIFAETLMEAGTPAVYRDAATRALAACEGRVDRRWWAAARYKVLTRSGAPPAEVDAAFAAYRLTEEHGNYGLNNDAWYLMVEIRTMGRFDALAHAMCEAMLREEGADLSNGNKDTVALGLYRAGELQRAVDLQTEAARVAGAQPAYEARLRRFQQALERQQK